MRIVAPNEVRIRSVERIVASVYYLKVKVSYGLYEGRKHMKKKVLLITATILTLAAFTACGKKSNPVVQETSLGLKLEDDAKEVVKQQQDSISDDPDQLLNQYTGD